MSTPCVRCDAPVEPQREVYVHPTCYACLPPPEPLPLVWLPSIDPGRALLQGKRFGPEDLIRLGLVAKKEDR